MKSEQITAESNGESAAGHDVAGPRSSNNPVDRRKFSVPLVVKSEVQTSARQPVTVGVPFPRGVLRDQWCLSLIDASGKHVPVQLKPLGHWLDGSIKWILLDFVAGPTHAGQSMWSLDVNRGGSIEVSHARELLSAYETDGALVVDTGAALFKLDRQTLAPLTQVELESGPVLNPEATGTTLVDVKGRKLQPIVESYEIEVHGPVRTTVLFEGSFDGIRRNRCRFRSRLSFFAGSSLVRFDLTLHNPRRARHRGGLWDLGDPGSYFFKDLALHLGFTTSEPTTIRWIDDLGSSEEVATSEMFEIYQDSSGGQNWKSRNHVNQHGVVPCQFRGYRVSHGGPPYFGMRASPVVSVQRGARNVTVAVPEFWQQFPKSIDFSDQSLYIRFFPRQFNDCFELQGGEQKTQTVWMQFSPRNLPGTASLKWVHSPVSVHCTPEWYSGAKVIPRLFPAQCNVDNRYDNYISTVVDGPNSFLERREVIDEYGWRNYGEVYADHEAAHYKGHSPIISHYNNQYDIIYGLLIQYLRMADSRWFHLADQLARHVIDIDIYHTNRDKAAYNGGQFWHTDHYLDAATSTHRAYSQASRRSRKNDYGGGPSNEHNYTTGLLHFYYLTGSSEARDAVLSLADWVIAMEEGSRTILGLIDDGPTGLASRTTQADYHGPGRGNGNSINALLDGWQLTRSRLYLEQAEILIRRAVHPRLDIGTLNLLETELRWSYTVFLSVLARYLALKAEAAELDAMYTYASSCLLSFASWMLSNELPYFDRPDKLDYPTETYAAQEFRKANVLRFAAQYADDALRLRLIHRGNELAERAWSDLLSFESSSVTRALAILMVEGYHDSHWRTDPVERATAPIAGFDHVSPTVFIAQKQRVLNQLKSPVGAFRAFLECASVRNWMRFLTRRSELTISTSSRP